MARKLVMLPRLEHNQFGIRMGLQRPLYSILFIEGLMLVIIIANYFFIQWRSWISFSLDALAYTGPRILKIDDEGFPVQPMV